MELKFLKAGTSCRIIWDDQSLYHKLWLNLRIKPRMYVRLSNMYEINQQTVLGHYLPTSKTPFIAGGLIVAPIVACFQRVLNHFQPANSLRLPSTYQRNTISWCFAGLLILPTSKQSWATINQQTVLGYHQPTSETPFHGVSLVC